MIRVDRKPGPEQVAEALAVFWSLTERNRDVGFKSA